MRRKEECHLLVVDFGLGGSSGRLFVFKSNSLCSSVLKMINLM